MLADLAARDMGSSGWLRRFGALKEEYLHHIREEEQEQFVAAEKRLSAADVRYMRRVFNRRKKAEKAAAKVEKKIRLKDRSEEHTSELQSLMRISYAVFCLKKKNAKTQTTHR